MGEAPFYSDESVTLHLGDCLDVLRTLEADSVDAICTDPPYGLEFMGKEWDGADGFRRSLNPADAGRDSVFGRTSRTGPEYRTAGTGRKGKPGIGDRPTEWVSNQGWNGFRCRNCGHLSHGGSPCTCEAPDFVRADNRWHLFQAWCEAWAAECLRALKPGGHMLAFGGTRTWHRMVCAIEDVGFEVRDSLDWIYGSGFPKNPACLKPAHEPIVMARKPSLKSAPLPGLDGCRVAGIPPSVPQWQSAGSNNNWAAEGRNGEMSQPHDAGRWPPNVVLGEEAAAELDRQSGVLTSGANPTRRSSDVFSRDIYGDSKGQPECTPHRGADSGGASRFFPVFKYEAKAAAHERPRLEDGTAHPTVKPVDLMAWLVRLVTPPGGVVLDPFAGSGATAEACIVENFHCVLIEKDPKSAELIRKRLSKPIQPTLFGDGAA